MVEILDGGLLDRRRLGDASIGDQDIQPFADDGTDLACELVRPIGYGEVRGDGTGPTSGLTDLPDDRFRRGLTMAVVDENLSAALRKGKGSGTTDAA